MKQLFTFAMLVVSLASYAQDSAKLECWIDIYKMENKIETLNINKIVKANSDNNSFALSSDKRFSFQISGTPGFTNTLEEPSLAVDIVDTEKETSSRFQGYSLKQGNHFRFEGGDLVGKGTSYNGSCSLKF